MPSPPPSPAPGPRWAVLLRRASADPGLPQGTGCLALGSRPPGLTELFVSPLVAGSSSTGAFVRNPFVLAADPSGILLLSGSLDGSPERTSYFLCDAVSNTVRQLPDIPKYGDTATGTAGLIVGSDRNDFMVAELVVPSSFDGATAILNCFSSETGGVWINKSVAAPFIRFPWCTDRVLFYMGKLWWADLSQGLLASDPLSAKPDLDFVPFPNVRPTMMSGRRVPRDPSSQRCVGLSGGKVRYVVITTRALVPKIKLWTLANPETSEWTLDYELSLKDIWDDPSYDETGLPNYVPVFALFHPNNPQVVYFFQREHLFGFNLRIKTVTECQPNDIGIDDASYNSVLAWEVPPSLVISSGPLSGEESQSPSAFDRIAASFSDACDRAIVDMEFRQFTRIALADLNKDITEEKRIFSVSECLSLCYFDDEANTKKIEYAHLNFCAQSGSKKFIVFAELAKDVDGCNSWTLTSCEVLTKNFHGGLHDEEVDVKQSKRTRKRKRSLYCFACQAELKHPKGGFDGGHAAAATY
uniref:DUF1618 domain-containing protein n=1 Tax=Arundo donax TaxID=35708 RepID=A0A0A8Z1P6_ARUDO